MANALVYVLREIRADDPRLRFRFVADELANQGSTASENWVWRLAAIPGLQTSHHRARGEGNKPGPAAPDDLLGVDHDNGRVTHDFNSVATGPDPVRLIQIIEHLTTSEGRLYLDVVADC